MTEPKGAPARALSKAARKAFVSAFDVRGAPLLSALRVFLACIVVPGEAGRVRRILREFARLYARQNPAGMAARGCGAPSIMDDAHLPGLSSDEVQHLPLSHKTMEQPSSFS